MSTPPLPPLASAVSRSPSAEGFAGPASAIAAVLGLARDLFGVSTALVSTIEGDRWRAAHVDDDAFGFAVGQTLRLQDTVCNLIGPDAPVLVNDLPQDPRGACFPTPLRLGVRTFLGVPLVLRDGRLWGTLCVLDRRVGALDEGGVAALRVLARLVVHELEHAASVGAAREEGEQRFRAMVESSDDAIVLTSIGGVVESWNPAAERTYGYSAAEAVGEPLARLMPSSDGHDLSQIFARLANGETVDRYQTRQVGKEGRGVDAEIAVSSVRDRTGRTTAISVIAHDVTEERAVQARLEAAERRERVRTGALLRTAEALNRTGSLGELMVVLAGVAAEAVGADRASVYAYDGGQTRTIAAGRYDAERLGGMPGLPAPPEEIDAVSPRSVPAEAEVIASQRPLRRDADTPNPPRYPPDDWCSDIIVPLLAGGAVQGVLYVRDSGRAREFTDDEVTLLQGIGHQAGLAILRARDVAAAEQRAEHLALLNGVGRALAGSLDVDDLCAAIHAEVAKVLIVDACYVALYEEGDSQVWFPYLVDRGKRASPNWLPLGSGPTSRVLRTRRAEVVTPGQGTAEPRGFTFGEERRSAAGLHVPMVRDERLIGAISVQRYDPTPYDAEELRTLETIAQQAAVAFAHARLYADTVAGRDLATRHAADLEAVLTISQSVSSATDVETMLDVLATELAAVVPYDVISLYRLDPADGRLRPIFARNQGVAFDAAAWVVRVGEGVVGHAFDAGRAELVNDAHHDPRSVYPIDAARYAAEGHHVAVAPLVVAGQRVGLLYLSRVGGNPFARDEFSLFEVLAEQASGGLRNAELLARNRELYLGGIEALAAAVDAKDPYTRGHSDRVRRLATGVAAALGRDRSDRDAIGLAALLHDVGKIGVPDAILQKPGPLDDAERAIMVGHAVLGADILAGAEALRPLVPLVQHHHERVDGSGYPDGLSGDAIPIGAAIIAVADAFDTMVTDRPYRPARRVDDAVAELRRRAGTQFRGDIVEALVDLVSAEHAGAGDGADIGVEPTLEVGQRGQERGTVAGQIGDTRALGLLVELATITHHIPRLNQFLGRVADIVRRRLDYQDVMLMLVDGDRAELVLAAHSGTELSIRPDHRQPLSVGVLGEVVRTGRPWNVSDVSREPRYHSHRTEAVGSELAVPLVVDGQVIGMINVESDRLAAFTTGDEAVLTAVAAQLASVVQVAQLHAATKRAADTDGLTGLANYRVFYDALRAATDAEVPLSLVVMDVEGLKWVNDTAGHLAGDALLRRVAQAIRRAVRAEDLVARYGGDEFVVIMRGVDREEATRVAARIRRGLQRSRRRDAVSGTVRFGVATLPEDGRREIDLVAVADRRLYEMRNRSRLVRRTPATSRTTSGRS